MKKFFAVAVIAFALMVAFAVGNTGNSVAAAPDALDTQAAALICLDTFCDTMSCGLDNGNTVTCSWDWTCDGSDNEEMIGNKYGARLSVGGELDAIALVEGWDIDIASSFAEIYIWNGVGSSSFLASDTFTINCVNEDRSHLPSVMSTLK